MIHIFHGDDQQASRAAFNQYLDSQTEADILRLDHKEINLDQINGFLNGPSLFPGEKIIAFSNYFSISKPVQDKLTPLLVKGGAGGGLEVDGGGLVIWQDKNLNASQLKTFPKASISAFKQNNQLWSCLNNLQPHNSKKFFPLFHLIIKDSYDLFLYLVKAQIRKQLITASRFSPASLKRAYLHLTELDFANKTGQLSIPTPIALERILLELMEH